MRTIRNLAFLLFVVSFAYAMKVDGLAWTSLVGCQYGADWRTCYYTGGDGDAGCALDLGSFCDSQTPSGYGVIGWSCFTGEDNLSNISCTYQYFPQGCSQTGCEPGYYCNTGNDQCEPLP